MFLYPNRERWFFNISSRNNWINIINNSFIFSYYWFSNFFFDRWVIFKPLLLREINMSSKRFTKGSYYLRVKSIFSAKLLKSIGIHKRFNTIKLKLNTWLFTFVEFPIFRVAFNSFQKTPPEFNSLLHTRTITRSIKHGLIITRKSSIKVLDNNLS